ncbi:hypothetical protein C4J81_17720 [Deltaproteobacteria bacterium Smac51]|nr:hypothetical protein C4J81_17720 [Deltaproteobacteria bacterium Smac51]
MRKSNTRRNPAKRTFKLLRKLTRQPPGEMFQPGEVTKDPRNLAGLKHFSRRRSTATHETLSGTYHQVQSRLTEAR